MVATTDMPTTLGARVGLDFGGEVPCGVLDHMRSERFISTVSPDVCREAQYERRAYAGGSSWLLRT